MSDYKFKRKSRPIFGAQDALREDTPEDTPRYDMMPTYDTELDNISRLSKQERFLSPFIHQPEKVTPLEYMERKSGRKPVIWKDIPEETKKRLEDKKTVVDAPTSREIDPITGTLLKYALAPGSGFAYGMGHAGDLAVESKKAFEEGDIGGGALGSLATLLRGGFSAATPFVPVLSAFATGGEVMSDVIGEEKTANIFTPVTQYTKPESLAGRSGAEIADLLIQLGLAKGVHSTAKGKRGQKIGEGFADEAGKIIGESLKPNKDFRIKPEETKGIKGLTQEKLSTDLAKVPKIDIAKEKVELQKMLESEKPKTEPVKEKVEPIVEKTEPVKESTQFTSSDTINRDFNKLKSEIGEKKAVKYFKNVDRLIDPNKNEIIEYRKNGVVTKEGDNYIFNSLVNMDTPKWGLSFKKDITGQFKPKEDIYLYHGTPDKNFTRFGEADRINYKEGDKGFFFTTNKEHAKEYGVKEQDPYGIYYNEGVNLPDTYGRVITAKLKSDKIKTIEVSDFVVKDKTKMVDQAIAEGYDAVKFTTKDKKTGKGYDEVIVFDKDKIEILKSEDLQPTPKVEKQPYEMTKDELKTFMPKPYKELPNYLLKNKQMKARDGWENKIDDYHKKSIEQAIKEGKKVPDEVLKDYPELTKKVEKPVEKVEGQPLKKGDWLKETDNLDKVGQINELYASKRPENKVKADKLKQSLEKKYDEYIDSFNYDTGKSNIDLKAKTGNLTIDRLKAEAKAEMKEPPKPKTLYDVLRDKTEYDVKVIATELNKPTREINKQLKDLEFKGLITKRGKNFKPTEEMEVLLADIKKNPKKYGEDLNSLYSNPIPALVKGVDKATGFLDDVWQHAVGDKIFKKIEDAWMKILPEKVKEQIITNHNRPFDWVELKRETRNSIDRYNELAGKLYRDLTFKEGGGKLTNAEQVRLQQIIRGSVSKNEPLRMKADQAIKEIKALETIAKELEVLPIETYNTKLPRKRIAGLLEEKRTLVKEAERLEGVRKKRAEEKIDDIDRKIKSNFKHGGEGYFKRVYGSKEQGSKWAKYGVRPYKLDLTSAIRRKDIPWEVRKEMGEVLQAGYPVAKGVKLLGRDVSIGKMFEKVAENPEWASGVERPGFIQLPKDKKLGKLSDKFVEEKIASDILDIIEFTKPEYLNAVLKDVLTTWKATKTIMNPATHGRNVMSESIMADFGGVSHLKQAQLTPKAVELLKGKGERQAEWKLSGLQRTTFAEAELGRFLNERQGKKIISPNVGETLARIYGKASLVDTKFGETMRKFYQLENEFFKALHFLSAREKGMTIAESRNQANKWGMDYGDVPRIVEKMRTNPFIGMPFITWSFKAFPRIIEAAITRPITFWKYPLLFSAVTNYSLEKLGITEEEWQEIKSTLPDRMAQGMWMLIPFRDEQGKIQMLDLTYTLPYKDVYDVLASGYSLATSGVTNRDADIISGGLGLIQAPITQLMAEVVLNKSGYTKQPIFSEVDSPLEKATKTFDHIYKAFMPALAPEIPGMTEGGYSYHKLRSTISDKEDYYGRTFSLAPAIGSSFLGLKTSPVEPEKNLEKKSFRMGSQIADLGSKRNRILRDGGLSEEQRLSKAKDVDEEIEKLKAEKKELDKKITKDSEITKLERRIKRLQRISSQFGEDGKRRNQEKINKLKIELNKLTQ